MLTINLKTHLFRALPALCFCLIHLAAAAQESTYESVYAHYSILKEGSVVRLRHVRKYATYIESGVDLADPLRQIVPYTRIFFAGIFFNDRPRRALMIGLGGGGFNHLFNAAFTSATLQTVELDPMALELAQKHMAFTPNDHNRVAIADGRQYVRKSKEKWDWVILDAFQGSYIPFHLKTKEFYEEIKRILSPGGILITNLHSNSLLYDADVRTLQACFGQVLLFKVSSTNVIAIAANDASNMRQKMKAYSIDAANPILKNYLDLESIRKSLILHPEETLARGEILTDDFCPAEYLDSQER